MEFCSRVIYMRQKIMLDYTNLRIVLINRTQRYTNALQGGNDEKFS